MPDFERVVDMSSGLTKKSLLRVPGFSVNTPWADPSALAFMARMPPTVRLQSVNQATWHATSSATVQLPGIFISSN